MIPQIPTPTKDNTVEVLTAIKATLDHILGRNSPVQDDRLLTILDMFDRARNGKAKKFTANRVVLPPYEHSDTPTGQSLPGEVVNMLAGTLFLGRGSTVWGQLYDSGATMREGSWSFTSGSTQVIPRGLFMCVRFSGSVKLELYVSGGWKQSVAQFSSGPLDSDGTNVRLVETGASTATVYYLQRGP